MTVTSDRSDVSSKVYEAPGQPGSMVSVKARYAYHFHEPLDVVGQIIPFNFPILMAGFGRPHRRVTCRTNVDKRGDFQFLLLEGGRIAT